VGLLHGLGSRLLCRCAERSSCFVLLAADADQQNVLGALAREFGDQQRRHDYS